MPGGLRQAGWGTLSTLTLLVASSCLSSAHALRYQDLGFLPPFTKQKEPLFEADQWAVDPEQGLLTILMPVYPRKLELGYLKNQLRTYALYFNASSVKEFIITTPWDKMDKMQTFLDEEMRDYLQGDHARFKLVSDSDCVDQLAAGTMYDQKKDVYPGWVKQQLVKLSCAKIITTPYYLILDTDVLFIKALTAQQLFKVSPCSHLSRVCDTGRHRAFQARNDIYPLFSRNVEQMEWTHNTAKLLQLQVPYDWRNAIGVTPQVLSKDISLQLGEYIKDRFNTESWTQFLLDALHLQYKKNMTALGEKWNPPWTEFNLYWIYATQAEVFEDWHVTDVILQEFAIWSETEWGAWNPCEMTFKDTAIGYFNLVQSRMELEPSSIWDKFSHCLPPQEGSQADAHPASHHHLRRKTGTRKAHTVADRASTATG